MSLSESFASVVLGFAAIDTAMGALSTTSFILASSSDTCCLSVLLDVSDSSFSSSSSSSSSSESESESESESL